MVPQYTLQPAIFQMIDARRGDLFAVIADGSHYVVRAESEVINSEKATTRFEYGFVGLDAADIPSAIGIMQKDAMTLCTPLMCVALCPRCAGSMYPQGDTFACSEADCQKRI